MKISFVTIEALERERERESYSLKNKREEIKAIQKMCFLLSIHKRDRNITPVIDTG